jgi:hypothetical protein
MAKAAQNRAGLIASEQHPGKRGRPIQTQPMNAP